MQRGVKDGEQIAKRHEPEPLLACHQVAARPVQKGRARARRILSTGRLELLAPRQKGVRRQRLPCAHSFLFPNVGRAEILQRLIRAERCALVGGQQIGEVELRLDDVRFRPSADGPIRIGDEDALNRSAPTRPRSAEVGEHRADDFRCTLRVSGGRADAGERVVCGVRVELREVLGREPFEHGDRREAGLGLAVVLPPKVLRRLPHERALIRH